MKKREPFQKGSKYDVSRHPLIVDQIAEGKPAATRANLNRLSNFLQF
jgi:hypothetical protein